MDAGSAPAAGFISANMGTNRQPMGAAARGTRMRREREPLQNRVTPFGDVVAIPQRGLYIGNRGIIHDPATKMLLGRCWTTKAVSPFTYHIGSKSSLTVLGA